MIPRKPDPERGLSPERVRELIAQVDVEEAAAIPEPIPQGDSQWARATQPEQPGEQWRPSPGIDAMNAMYPASHPLTRERPPTPRTKVTLQQTNEIRRAMFGRSAWLMPYQKREFAEQFEIIDAPQAPMPIPESTTHHAAILADREHAKEASAAKGHKLIARKEEPKPKPRSGTTFFTAR